MVLFCNKVRTEAESACITTQGGFIVDTFVISNIFALSTLLLVLLDLIKF